MVRFSAVFVSLCAAACALAGSLPAKRQTPSAECTLDVVIFILWVNTVEGALAPLHDNTGDAELLGVIDILNDLDVELLNDVVSGDSVSSIISEIDTVLAEAKAIAIAINSTTLSDIEGMQAKAQEIAVDCD